MFTDKFNSLQIKLTHVEHSNTEAAQMLSLLVQKILQWTNPHSITATN